MYGSPPCRDCERREMGCHGKCSMYQEWQRKNEEIKHKIQLKEEVDHYSYGRALRVKLSRWKNNEQGR